MTCKLISLAAAIAAVISAFVSATYWYRSSKVPVPDEVGVGWGGPAYLKPLTDPLRTAAHLNRKGAAWAAITAAFTAVSIAAPLFGP